MAAVSHPPPAPNPDPAKDEKLGWGICVSPLVIPIAVLTYAAADHLNPGTNFGSVTAVGFAAGAAALISGVFVGFLFGLPQTLAQSKPTGLLRTNTSLDQITDWLTKILVGLGLVQLGKIGHGVSKLSSSLAPGLGGATGAKAFGTALLVYGAASGFLLGYLWARIVLSKRFNAAARALEKETVEQVDAALKQTSPTPLPPLPPEPKP
jgi:predicted PurR-regulated permease PerM